MFSDPFAKLCTTALLASQAQKAIYLDLDTTFTAYFRTGLIAPANGNASSVDIYLPSEGRLVPMIKEILESMPSSSLVIFDSINSFYNLFKSQEKSLGRLNHLLSVLIMLLVRRGVETGVPVLATSMLRYRKEGEWIQSPASRRLLQTKSAVRMMVQMEERDSLRLEILQHDTIAAGTEVVFKNSVVVIA